MRDHIKKSDILIATVFTSIIQACRMVGYESGGSSCKVPTTLHNLLVPRGNNNQRHAS